MNPPKYIASSCDEAILPRLWGQTIRFPTDPCAFPAFRKASYELKSNKTETAIPCRNRFENSTLEQSLEHLMRR